MTQKTSFFDIFVLKTMLRKVLNFINKKKCQNYKIIQKKFIKKIYFIAILPALLPDFSPTQAYHHHRSRDLNLSLTT